MDCLSKRSLDVQLQAALREWTVSSADALPGDDFVNPLFNSVVLIALGIVSVKSRRLACLISCIAIIVLFGSTWARDDTLSTAPWKTAPASAITPDDVYQFLMLSLVRWVASTIFAAFNVRWTLSFLTFSTPKPTLRQKWFPMLFFCVAVFFRGCCEFRSFQAISSDWGLVFHFILAQGMDTARAALQVVLLFQHLNTSTKRGKVAVAHMFTLSSLVLTQNILSYGLWNLFSCIDILLQLHVMTKTCRAYGNPVNLIRAIPASLRFPPYDNDFVTEDLVEAIAPTLLSLLPSAESDDLEPHTSTHIHDSVHLDGDPKPVTIHPHHHSLPSHVKELDSDISDEDSRDLPLHTFECVPKQETSRLRVRVRVHAPVPMSECVPGSLVPGMVHAAFECLHSQCVPNGT